MLEESDEEDATINPRTEISLCETEQRETHEDADINPALGESERNHLKELLREFSDIFSDLPGNTHLGEHRIQLLREEPVRTKVKK